MPKKVIGTHYKGKVRRRLRMEDLDAEPASSGRGRAVRPSEFETNLSHMCSILVRHKGLREAEIDALCKEYDVHKIPVGVRGVFFI